MFYSTDILTRRRGQPLGLVWLSATLGPKGGTSFKKISRKEIMGINLVSVCEQLASPEEPFALRLSSNLLCGIARVYQQQYVIYQADVTHVHQSLKKAFNDAFKNPIAAASVDLAPTPVQGPAATTAAQGIYLPIDPALAVLGWDPNWDVGINWAEVMQGGSGYGAGEGEIEFGSGVEREGTPDSIGSGRVHHQPSDKHKVKDLASITLHEPHIDDYLLRDHDDPAMRLDDGLGGEAFIIGEDEPGLLEGMSPELDALLQVDTEGRARSRSRAGSGGSGARYGASSSAHGGDMGGMYDEDLGGMDLRDAAAAYDQGEFQFDGEIQGMGDETYEERVRREHEEAAAQRSGLAGAPRASSIDQQQNVELSPEAATSSSNKRKSSAVDGGDLALPAPAKPKRSPKKLKHIIIDSEISLTDEQVVKARASYPDRMERERARAERAKLDKEGGARAVDLIFAPPEGFGGPLADFWKSTVVDQLVRPGEGRAAAEKKRKAADKSGQPAKKRKSEDGQVEIGRSGEFGDLGLGEWELGADFHANKEYDAPLNDLGGMEPEIRFDELDEYGRAGSQGALTGSGKENFPWNEEVVTSDIGAGFVAGGASSQGGTATARISQDTPLKAGDKRRSRTGSLVPSALGSGRAGSTELVQGDFEEFQIVDEALVSQEASQPNAEVLATKLEHDSLKFLSFANRKALARPDEDLLFSDIVPIASTSNGTAAAAFYHLLALATRGDIKVEQSESYGEITVEIMVPV